MGNSHAIPELIQKILNSSLTKAYSPDHKRTFCYIDDFINFIL